MIINTNGLDSKLNFGEPKRWFKLTPTSGNLEIEYLQEKKIYVISRTDKKPFDGTEDVGGLWYGNMIKPNTLEEKITFKIEELSGIQIEPEANLFQEFDYQFNEENTKIYVYPIFLENISNMEFRVQEEIDSPVSLFIGARKRVRRKRDR